MKNTKTPAMPREEISELLFGLLKSLYRFERREVEEFGLTYQQIFLLKILRRSSRLKVGEIAAEMRLPMFGATRLIDQMQKSRLLSRSSDKSDRRSKIVEITRKGLDLVARIEEQACSIVLQNLQDFSEGELAAVLRVVQAMDRILGVGDPAQAVETASGA